MDDLVGAKLKELLASSVRDELLDDPRRLAELVRERLGPDHKREASFLNTVMQEGVPKRLLTMSSSSLTSAMIANYAKKISDDTGLREDLAHSAIEAWSAGLGLALNDSGLEPKTPPEMPTEKSPGAVETVGSGQTWLEQLQSRWGSDDRIARGVGAAIFLWGGLVQWCYFDGVFGGGGLFLDFWERDGLFLEFWGGIGVMGQLIVLSFLSGLVSAVAGAGILVQPRRYRSPYVAAATALAWYAVFNLLIWRFLRIPPPFFDARWLAVLTTLTGGALAAVCFGAMRHLRAHLP